MLLGSIAASTAFAADTASPMQMLANQQTPSAAPATAGQPASTSTTSNNVVTPNSTSTMPAEVPAAIDCTYTISPPFSDINSATIIQWANYAAIKTFTYDFQNYDKQFNQLKNCYTTTGWESFNEAMKVSNNLKVAQDEHLFVSAKLNGQSQLVSQSNDSTQPSWVVRIPLNVAYQNQDREVSQDMYIDLTIKTIYAEPARLGINQIIASPKSTAPTTSSSSTATATPNASEAAQSGHQSAVQPTAATSTTGTSAAASSATNKAS